MEPIGIERRTVASDSMTWVVERTRPAMWQTGMYSADPIDHLRQVQVDD